MRPSLAGGRNAVAPAFVAVIACLHVITALLLVVTRQQWPLVVGFASLAYVLGVRHAFDADHIVAIDGTTRQLLARHRDATGVGFWFSLGHSSVVCALALWVARAAESGSHRLPIIRTLGGILGAATSSAFMLVVALMNLGVFRDTLKTLRRTGVASTSMPALQPLTLMSRLFARALACVSRPRDMYVVGLLFGLGLDTASEVALLAIAATAGARSLPALAVLVLPVSFASGMCLADTVEGFVVARAYAWSHSDSIRRARYNLVVTGFTVLSAFTVSALEFSGIGATGATDSLTAVGLGIVTMLLAAWGVAAAATTLRRGRTA